MAETFTVAVDGAQIHGQATGFGLPVVFLHAGVSDSRLWQSQIEAVASAGFYAIAYDRRGFGQTQAADVPFSHLDDLEAVLDQLGIHAAIFVGCSMGGALALDFALENPERTVGLVLVGTSVTGEDDSEGDLPEEAVPMFMSLDAAMEDGDLETVNRIHAHAWLDGPLSENGRVDGPARDLFFDMNALALNHLKLTQEQSADDASYSLGTITAPVLLVVGELDFPHIVERHNGLSDELENAFAVVLEGTAHLPSLERPDLFNPLLLEFLDAVSGEGALPEGEG